MIDNFTFACDNVRMQLRGCSLVVKHQLPKLRLWVRFPSSAPKPTENSVGFFMLLPAHNVNKWKCKVGVDTKKQQITTL